MAKNIRKLSKEQFGLLLPLIENDDITEINWNGRNLIIKDLRRGALCIRSGFRSKIY